MLTLQDVRKSYTTGGFTQVALDDVSISFRDNEFVAVLGPSGSGKTTMLNIVGGLDHYDSGDLVIDGIPTQKYRDRDWDGYRNNRVGFVFQSYNLIPHQSVAANVELALTLSGVSRTERRQRALAALDQVGLSEHAHKLPSQLSGGQMQRVAIARALINDPEILLADEPTGALDSKTSVQIMGLLTRIAGDRLVIMVTHNAELAERYATRVVQLKDGAVAADSDPYLPADAGASEKPSRRTAMSFLTAIALSFSNLMTKKGRTLMTAFAGSIGIIGIAAILALANGVNAYIKHVEEDTLSVYPLTIQSQGFDMAAMLATSAGGDQEQPDPSDEPDPDGNGSSGEVQEARQLKRMFSSIGSNDLASLKRFLQADGGGINAYVNSIQYSYNVTPQIFSLTEDWVRQVNPDSSFSTLGFGSAGSTNALMASAMNTNVFAEMPDDTRLVEEQYDVRAGRWPSGYDETVLVLTPSGRVSDFLLYSMGLRDPAELDAMVKQMAEDSEIVTPSDSRSYSYDELLAVTFKLVEAADYYAHDAEFEVWTDKSRDEKFLRQLAEDGDDLRIVGIVQPKEDATATALSSGIYYTPALTHHLIERAAVAPIVASQLAQPDVNVFTGRTFADEEENPQREDFDLSSLMEIDEDAIAKAFTFDSSKLKLDLSGLDLNLSGLKIDPSAMPSLDLGDMLGGIDVADLVAGVDLSEIIAAVDPADLLAGVDLGLDPESVTDLATRLLQGYLEFTVAGGLDPSDVETNFPLFLESEAGQAIAAEAEAALAEVQEALGKQQAAIVEKLTASIGDAVAKQLAASTDKIQAQLQKSMTGYMEKAMKAVSTQISTQLGNALRTQLGAAMEKSMSQLADTMSEAMGIDQDAFAEAFKFKMDEEELAELLASMMTTRTTSCDANLVKLGYADFANPSRIDIYPIDFESKGRVIEILDGYNEQMRADGLDDRVITYTDIVGTLMSSVTDIVNMISYVLTAFVAISLVVSSIMIGVITYISVLERRKEIGILRSIGASKRDIRRVFNAETLIVGFIAGLLGIVVTLLLTIPANAIVLAQFDVPDIAQLPWQAGIVLVGTSMILTFIAGLIPASAASRKDPVEALRSE
ncbi:MAG: ABC transporter ATP-binding protein/permease [Propionicimonas sp.]